MDGCFSIDITNRIVSGVLKDKQAAAGLHKLGQHAGYNPVELSRWGARLWGLNRAGQRISRQGKTSTRQAVSGRKR